MSNRVYGPGSRLAILGGGQLGRMTAMAARTLGYRVRVMDPDAHCPASFVVDEVIVGKWADEAAAARLAADADVATIEIEQIAVDALSRVAAEVPLRPGVEPVRMIQDKTLQKIWLREEGFTVGPFAVAENDAELAKAVTELGGRVFVKTAQGGYDGRGQVRIGFDVPVTADEAWHELGQRPVVVEKALDLDFEISVMAARSASGEVKAFPAARNHHENQILAWSVLPAGIDAALEARAEKLAADIIERIGLVGLLCIEMFVTKTGELFVNEMAPRPHNSYHQSERACATSQFEQLVRAVCNLPLGDVAVERPAAIVNLLGDEWLRTGTLREPDWAAALTVPTVRVHLYQKHEPRMARKMGHLSATGATAEEALERVLLAKKLLAGVE